MTSLQRQGPGDPRAKAIEAMARAEREVARRVYDGHDKRAEALLAALEAEGWGLTDTREACRNGHEWETSGDPATRCVRCGVPWATDAREVERTHRCMVPCSGDERDDWCYAHCANAPAREALSSVPVEEEERP